MSKFFVKLLILGWLSGWPSVAIAWANPVAQFRTVFGTIEVELLSRERPATVANFIRYLESGRYDGTFFHRVQSNFLAAAGCYRGINRGTIEANYARVEPYKQIVNETREGTLITNVLGTLSLGQVINASNRLTSEFFFSLGTANGQFFTQNQGGYPVFGRIRNGLEVLERLNKFPVLREVRPGATNVLITISDPDLPEYLFGVSMFPVLLFDPEFEVRDQVETLVYLDITLLNVDVQAVEGGVKIGWDSAKGRPNVVEFTRVFPPVWETLARVTGTGDRMNVDDTSGEVRRFHRVRIEY